ncbi:MAG TPA: DNA N-6-adenine-methyltransferase [Yeosuana sp.]
MNKIHFSSLTDHWSTPRSVFDKLDNEFDFNYDPCPLNADFDGLSMEWGERTFCNPPYSKLSKWIEKAYKESLKNKLIVLLIPSRTDTKAWHEYIMKSTDIRFIKGRLKFGNAKHNAPFPSVIVVFDGRI